MKHRKAKTTKKSAEISFSGREKMTHMGLIIFYHTHHIFHANDDDDDGLGTGRTPGRGTSGNIVDKNKNLYYMSPHSSQKQTKHKNHSENKNRDQLNN